MSNQIDHIFSALADPTRRRILEMLLEDDMAVSDVADPFEMSLAAISKHLRVLVAAGLIAQERRGRVTWCKLDPRAMREVSAWLQGFGQFEAVDLDAFERFLEREFGSDDAKQRKHCDDDDDKSNDIDNAVHGAGPFLPSDLP